MARWTWFTAHQAPPSVDGGPWTCPRQFLLVPTPEKKSASCRALLAHGGRGGARLPCWPTPRQSQLAKRTRLRQRTGAARFSDLTLRTPPPPPSLLGSSSSTDCTSPPPRVHQISHHTHSGPGRSIDRATMDTDTTSTDSQFRHPAPAISAAGARAVVCSLAARGAESLARGLVTCVFATVGTVLGAITGGLIGLATETGVLRGTGVGGITGALVSMEVVESSLALWRSDEPAIWSVVYVLDVIWSLLTGRLVREKVDPAVLNAVESQMSAAEATVLHGDHADIFGMGGTNGMARVAIDALPVVRFTERSSVDASGDLIACSVCLQEFQAGDSARSLPVCRHTFHLPCIDGWLLRHASCPLCRRSV
ncbi:hypothetical protein BDA96_02G297100 [Sorghum bicolor]|uniref:RING-type domain-containing protein n=2 Tax=Sorghum bicolor TaxID=4558 RepID=A0A921RRB6_SORBI|nr:NEP1-interacting protein-like 1 isoform X2 [Sorghum bicolor]KAG0544681.1 hypothetical protein BDA96_02G297100 [Sorghum bicolor]KXG36092.1 hypothetical protein SORBI_3002G282000 [Sorghum bicolor]|eukprot:XP_002462759.2 NEP1-interacting protein-like 1 isoform X2 [Sorghum bicolor]